MPEEKKIIIDEDWKSQVQAEREAAEQAKSKPTAGSAADDDPPMPPASLEMLLTTLATEAMMALGQIPNPVSGESTYRPQQAKYLIDTIELLQQKTKGNLTPAEEQAVENLLHQLRMVFVAGPPKASAPSEAKSEAT